jgi:hypothetical protein
MTLIATRHAAPITCTQRDKQTSPCQCLITIKPRNSSLGFSPSPPASCADIGGVLQSNCTTAKIPPPQEHVGVTCLLSPWRARRGQPPSAVLRHGRRRNKVPADAEFLYVQSIDAIRHHSRPPLMSTSALVLPPWRGINGEPQPPRRPQMGPLHRGDAPRHLPHQLQASSSPDLAGVVGSHHWRPASPVSGSRGPPAHRQACL